MLPGKLPLHHPLKIRNSHFWTVNLLLCESVVGRRIAHLHFKQLMIGAEATTLDAIE